MNLSKFLDRFQKEYQLSLTRDIYDSTSVLINKEIAVHFKEIRPDCFIIYSLICPIPNQEREAFLEEILKLNLYGTQTAGMGFGIDTKTQSLIQFYRFDPPPNEYSDIFNKLKKFVAVAQNYKKLLKKNN